MLVRALNTVASTRKNRTIKLNALQMDLLVGDLNRWMEDYSLKGEIEKRSSRKLEVVWSFRSAVKAEDGSWRSLR